MFFIFYYMILRSYPYTILHLRLREYRSGITPQKVEWYNAFPHTQRLRLCEYSLRSGGGIWTDLVNYIIISEAWSGRTAREQDTNNYK